MENLLVPTTAEGHTTYSANGQAVCAMSAAEDEADAWWRDIAEVLLVLMFGTFHGCKYM